VPTSNEVRFCERDNPREMLPKWTSSWRDVAVGDGDLGAGNSYICQLGRNFPPEWPDEDKESRYFDCAKTEADARAKLLIYLIEKELVKP